VAILSIFSSSYYYESLFSTMNFTKSETVWLKTWVQLV